MRQKDYLKGRMDGAGANGKESRLYEHIILRSVIKVLYF